MTKPIPDIENLRTPHGHLTGAERAQVELLHRQGHGPAAIGRLLGRAKSTVSRELRRFEAGVPYDAARAQAAELLAARPRRASRLTPARKSEIRLALGMGWSMNGLLRRYLPRGIAFPHEEVDHEWIEEVETEVNGRPRRMHAYRTPAEVAEERSCPAI